METRERDLATETFATRYKRMKDETREANWDGEGAKAIPDGLWEIALGVAKRLAETAGESFMSPGSDGAVYLRWAANGDVFDVECHPSGCFRWMRKVAGVRTRGETSSLGELEHELRAIFH